MHSWKSIAAFAALAGVLVDGAAVDTRGNGNGNGNGPNNGHGGGNDKKPLVESAAIRKLLKIDSMYAKAEQLQSIAYNTPGKNRVIGSQGHQDTVNWIKSHIEKHPDYYTIELQAVPLSLGESANLTVNGVPTEVYAVDLAPAGHVSGDLVNVPNLGCEEADYAGLDLTGKVAIIFRGTCEFGVKVGLAASHGAVGVIAYNNSPGNLKGYSLQKFEDESMPYVPVGGISQADGEALVALLKAGTKVTVDLTTRANLVKSQNVIIQTKGGDQKNIIHVGGHSDSVTAGPGMNDNGSGTISILEIALHLTKFKVNNAVRFSWWTAEEAGLLGAQWYVDHLSQEEKDKIRLFLDFDMMASPNFAYQIYDGDGSAFNATGPAGSSEAEREFTRYFDKVAHLNHTEIEFDGRSDYGPFLEAGIAAGGIAGGAEGIKTVKEQAMFGGAAGVPYDVNYHEDGDTVDNLNLECWIEMTRAIAHMTATYARSFSSIPRRNKTTVAKRAEEVKASFRKTARFQKYV